MRENIELHKNENKELLLKAENVKKYFDVGHGTLKAVDGISFDLYKGETL